MSVPVVVRRRQQFQKGRSTFARPIRLRLADQLEILWSGNFFLIAPFPDHCLFVHFYVEPPCVVALKLCSRYLCHMTQWPPRPYMVKTLKNLFLQNRWANSTKYVASGTPVYQTFNARLIHAWGTLLKQSLVKLERACSVYCVYTMFPAAPAAPFARNVACRGILVKYFSVFNIYYVFLSFLTLHSDIRNKPW